MKRRRNGAPTGTRTRDPMIKSHLLYQLSYGRICDNLSLGMRLIYTGSRKMQMTFAKKIRFFCFLRFSERRNSRWYLLLRFGKKIWKRLLPIWDLWSEQWDSNPRLSGPKPDALPGCAMLRFFQQYSRWTGNFKRRNKFFDEMLLNGLYSQISVLY